MPKYIDAEMADEIIESDLGFYDTTKLKQMLKYFPTADVVPAKKLKAAQEQIKMLETLVFGIVRNSSVYPTGVALGKSQKEVTLKTFETIEEIKKIMDFDRMREFMALKEATDEENT